MQIHPIPPVGGPGPPATLDPTAVPANQKEKCYDADATSSPYEQRYAPAGVVPGQPIMCYNPLQQACLVSPHTQLAVDADAVIPLQIGADGQILQQVSLLKPIN